MSNFQIIQVNAENPTGKILEPRDLKALLIALNSTDNTLGKYPIGNKELCTKVKLLESQGAIRFDTLKNKWGKVK